MNIYDYGLLPNTENLPGMIGFDFAGFGRTIFAYPDFAKDILTKGEADKNKICLCCGKCTEIMRTPGGTPGCVIRDKEVYAPIYRKQCGGAENE